MDFYERALELKEETIENRRYMHQHAETGLYLPKTKEYVMNKLQEYGLDPKPCGDCLLYTSFSANMQQPEMESLPH